MTPIGMVLLKALRVGVPRDELRELLARRLVTVGPRRSTGRETPVAATTPRAPGRW